MKTTKHIALIFILFPTMVMAQLTNREVKAKIEVEENADFISIVGYAENLTDVYKSLFYKLSVIKTDKKSNNSNNIQSGRFTLEANQMKTLSKTQINLSKDNQTIVLLLIYDENQQLVGKDRYVIGDKNVGEGNTKKLRDGVEITGIISDETKTKMGKEFYDTFYNEFNQLKINSTKIIVVEEELTSVRSTRIKVKIDSDVINEFITKPDEEFLTSMAEESAAKAFNYFKNLEKQSKYITQY